MYKGFNTHACLKHRLAQVLTAFTIQSNWDGHDCTGKVGHLLFVRCFGMFNQMTDVVRNYPHRSHYPPIDVHMLLTQQFFWTSDCIAQNTNPYLV